jgi:hypothetical protein
MPKLIHFVACEKVIVDELLKSVSLISVLESLTVPVSGELPEDAGAPLMWAILALWRREEGEEDKYFEQRVQMFVPNGEKFAEEAIAFQMYKLNHRVRQGFVGIRVGIPGDIILKLSVRPAGGEDEWKEVAEYPIHILHELSTEPKSDGTNEESRSEATEVG